MSPWRHPVIFLGICSLLCVLLILALVGCDDRASPTPTSAASTPSAPWNNPNPESNPTEKVFFSAFSMEAKHLDPAVSYDVGEYTFISPIYEPPLQYDYYKRPYTLVPLTTTALPSIQYLNAQQQPLPENTTEAVAFTVYTLTLKPHIQYQPHPALAKDHEGKLLYHALTGSEGFQTLADFPSTGTRELTAEDYVYQIKRLADPRLGSPIYGLMSEYIVGLTELNKALTEALAAKRTTSHKNQPLRLDLRDFPLTGAKTTSSDPLTYQITIKGKYPQFIHWLTMSFFVPMPWETEYFYQQPGMLENNLSLDTYPIGTGTFMLTENNPQRRMVLSKNPNFDHEVYPASDAPEDQAMQRLAGLTLPLLDKIVFVLEKESTAYWNKFLQGYYDLSGISSDAFQTAIQFDNAGNPVLSPTLSSKGIRLRVQSSPGFFYWGFNMKDDVVGGFGEKARQLRQFIRQHLNVDEYIRLFMNGRGIHAAGPLPPDIEGYTLQPPIALDPTLDTIEKPKTLYFDTYSTGDPEENLRNRWLQTQFEKMGITLVIRATDTNRFQEKFRTGNLQLFFYGWDGDYPDPENFFSIFYGPNAATLGEGGFNGINYQSADFDRAFEAYRQHPLTPSPQKTALISEMIHRLNEDAPCVWGMYPRTFGLLHEWLVPTKPSGIIRNNLKYLSLDPKLRLERQWAWNQPVVWPLWVLFAILVGGVGWYGSQRYRHHHGKGH